MEGGEMGANPIVKTIYGEIVDAVSGFGTDPEKLVNAVNRLKSVQDFVDLTKMFSDGKTGYKTFEEMINGEFESDNYVEAKEILEKLNKIGVGSDFNKNKNILGEPIFVGGFKITNYQDEQPRVGSFCTSKWNKLLPSAKNYWIQWLSSPITKSKFKKNWGITNDNEVNDIFKKYINAINKLSLVFYDNYMREYSNSYTKDVFAFVHAYDDNTKIYVNCSLNDKTPYESLVHEIQHILYAIKPLNPEKQVGDVFVSAKTKKMGPQSFFGDVKNTTQVNQNSMVDASKKYGIDSSELEWWLREAQKYESTNPGYICDQTEKMSNIMAVRKLLNINPGENITKEMLKPYITGNKDSTDIGWILACWALNGFGDIDVMLNKMNQLAIQNTKNNVGSRTA